MHENAQKVDEKTVTTRGYYMVKNAHLNDDFSEFF